MLLKLENIGKIYDSNDILTVGIRGIDLAFDYNEKGSCTLTASRLRTIPKAIGKSTAKRTSPPSFRTSIS